MNIALIGHGKMGQAIEQIAIERGHKIVSIIDVDNIDDIGSDAFKSADVAIEFTRPDAAIGNYRRVFATGVPLVSGTTGWGQPEQLDDLIASTGATFLWSSNYSLGVNIFFALNRYLAKIMAHCPQYTPSVDETHHIHKLDHPSGTAKTLAADIIDSIPTLTGWTEQTDPTSDLLTVTHQRVGEVPGIHTVKWDSPLDTITITHSAKTRHSFALGAVLAAEWLPGRHGRHTIDEMMSDLLA